MREFICPLDVGILGVTDTDTKKGNETWWKKQREEAEKRKKKRKKNEQKAKNPQLDFIR